MRKILTITLFAVVFSAGEFILYNLFGRWLTPNLSILLIIFFNLFLGIRYSLYTATIVGILKDSFGISAFGINLFSFIICAFLTTLIKRYMYRRGSRLLRLGLIFLVTISNFFIQFFLHSMFAAININIFESIKFNLMPELIITLILANYVFDYLKLCVSKSSVYLS